MLNQLLNNKWLKMLGTGVVAILIAVFYFSQNQPVNQGGSELTNAFVESQATPSGASEQGVAEQEQPIAVSLNIHTTDDLLEYSVTLPGGASVLDALKQVDQDHQLRLDYTEYDFGVFVEQIAGLRNSEDQGMYWLYSVNAQSAEVGADSYILKEGDIIVWQYKKADM